MVTLGFKSTWFRGKSQLMGAMAKSAGKKFMDKCGIIIKMVNSQEL